MASRPPGGRVAKRVLDVAFSFLLLVVLAPLLACCALAVLLADGWPVLFLQERVGRCGRHFRLVKLRTMREAPGSSITAAGDPRVTAIGRVLRRLKLDELPQLWNVVVGEMSLVGPRPEVPEYVTRLARAYRPVLDLRPGITDWASLAFRDEERLLAVWADDPSFYVARLLPRKLALARLYGRRRSVGLDLKLVLATACAAAGLEPAARLLVGKRLLHRARAGLLPPPVAPGGP